MEIFKEMMGKLANEKLEPPTSIRRTAAWSEEDGDELCLDRLKYGQPYWKTTRRSHRPGPVNVTIVSDIAAPSHVSHTNILWRGAAAVCLTFLLEEAGYRVELLVGQYSTNNAYQSSDNHSLNILELKHCEDPLDESTLINAVSAWVYRTVFFVSTFQEGERKHRTLMGRATPLSRLMEYITPDRQVLLCENIWSEQAAVSWIKQQLEKFANGEFAIQS